MVDFPSEALPLPVIDDRSEEELFEQARLRVFNESQGVLNDFTENNPLAALLQGQVFAGAELLWRCNKIVPALAIQFYKNAGVERRLGTKATVALTFTLKQLQSIPFTIESGTEVTDSSGKYSFLTDERLVIPANVISGQVTATAARVGSGYNVAPFTITQILQPLTNLSTVINTQAAQGGSDKESDESVILRGNRALRQRGLVSRSDYEQAATEILGEGSVAKAIGLLAADKQSYQIGAVHLFILNSDASPGTSAQLNQVEKALKEQLHIGTSLYISPMELLEVDGDIIAPITSGQNATKVAEGLWNAFKDYLAPTSLIPGQTLVHSEVGYNLRLAGGIQRVDQLRLNQDITNVPMPNEFTLPVAHSLYVKLIDERGASVYEGIFGIGDVI